MENFGLSGFWEGYETGGGLSDKMGGVTNGKALAFGRAEVQLTIFGPTGTDV